MFCVIFTNSKVKSLVRFYRGNKIQNQFSFNGQMKWRLHGVQALGQNSIFTFNLCQPNKSTFNALTYLCASEKNQK